MKLYPSILFAALSCSLSSSPLLAAEKNLQVPFKYGLGKNLYEKHCGSCHGNDGFGADKKGPPLMHKYYEPSHHGDASFYRAVQKGVKQHHWQFGKMEPVPEVSERSIAKMIPYVRWLQRQHGIH